MRVLLREPPLTRARFSSAFQAFAAALRVPSKSHSGSSASRLRSAAWTLTYETATLSWTVRDWRVSNVRYAPACAVELGSPGIDCGPQGFGAYPSATGAVSLLRVEPGASSCLVQVPNELKGRSKRAAK